MHILAFDYATLNGSISKAAGAVCRIEWSVSDGTPTLLSFASLGLARRQRGGGPAVGERGTQMSSICVDVGEH